MHLIHEQIQEAKQLQFSDLVSRSDPPALIVVRFLAILELYKRNMLRLEQDRQFGDIAISYVEGSGELNLNDDGELTSVGEVGH